nr:hypothetical protein [Tanacetum cinerariifolium]
MNQNSYNSNSLGFDQPQPPQSPVIHQPPQEMTIQEMEDLKQQYLDELKCLSNLKYHDEIKIAELTENFNGMSIEIRKGKSFYNWRWANLSTHPLKCLTSFCYDDDDDEDYTSANQFEDFSASNDEFSSLDDDSFFIDNIDYIEATPPDSELVSSEVMEIVIPKVGGIDDDILLTIKDDILHEKLLNVNLFIDKIEALNANPTPSFDCKTESFSISLNSLLEETNTFDNSLLEFETFCFEVEEISSGSTTTRPDISLPEYEVFYDDHVKEICSGSPTTLLILLFMLRSSLIFRSTHFLLPIGVEPNLRDFTKDVVEDISLTKEPKVHNTLPTHPTLQLILKF